MENPDVLESSRENHLLLNTFSFIPLSVYFDTPYNEFHRCEIHDVIDCRKCSVFLCHDKVCKMGLGKAEFSTSPFKGCSWRNGICFDFHRGIFNYQINHITIRCSGRRQAAPLRWRVLITYELKPNLCQLGWFFDLCRNVVWLQRSTKHATVYSKLVIEDPGNTNTCK